MFHRINNNLLVYNLLDVDADVGNDDEVEVVLLVKLNHIVHLAQICSILGEAKQFDFLFIGHWRERVE